ncbi:hypothetical protein D3C81_2109590 [compost metagenome]
MASPGAGVEERSHEGRAKRDGFHFVASDKAPVGIEVHLVTDQAGHDGAAIEMHRVLELCEHRSGGMAHVVFTDHPGAVANTMREQCAGRIKQ